VDCGWRASRRVVVRKFRCPRLLLICAGMFIRSFMSAQQIIRLSLTTFGLLPTNLFTPGDLYQRIFDRACAEFEDPRWWRTGSAAGLTVPYRPRTGWDLAEAFDERAP